MTPTKEIKRTFILGEEWIYYKLYCGSYSADAVLTEYILPIVRELKKKKLIDYWFFIRYSDPKTHLRLRFHLSDKDKIHKIIKLTHPYFSKLIENDIVFEVVTASYRREMERYGKTSIEEIEKIFYYHSKKTIKLIKKTAPEHDEITRIFASLCMIENLLSSCFSIAEKQNFISNLQQRFKNEHNIQKENNKKLDLLYRRYRKEIECLLTEKQDPENLKGLTKILKTKKKELEILNTIRDKVNENTNLALIDLLASIIHMNINRTFRSKQRQYEMLCYDFMNRYYKSKSATK